MQHKAIQHRHRGWKKKLRARCDSAVPSCEGPCTIATHRHARQIHSP
jgi:hypothetical protein